MSFRAEALAKLSPNAKWTMRGDDITWEDESQIQPTEQELVTKTEELKAEYEAKSYARSRQQNFPNEHDLLIALWEKVVEGRSESADTLEVKRQEVKTAHPKPE